VPKTLGIIAGISCLSGAVVCYNVTTWWKKRTVRRRLQRGLKKEAKGERLLKKAGYQIEAIQQPITATITIGGKPVSYQIRPDAIVSKAGRRFVAEIKTGEVAGNPLFTDTRRQLLEYRYFSNADGLLFVNADKGIVEEVKFPPPKIFVNKSWGKILLLMFASAAVGYFAGKWL